jgi:hypothetical protein
MQTNKIVSATEPYSASLYQDPYNNKQYVACLHDFDVKEIVDGYTLSDMDNMIEFLVRVQTELRFKNACLETLPLYSTHLE